MLRDFDAVSTLCVGCLVLGVLESVVSESAAACFVLVGLALSALRSRFLFLQIT